MIHSGHKRYSDHYAESRELAKDAAGGECIPEQVSR